MNNIEFKKIGKYYKKEDSEAYKILLDRKYKKGLRKLDSFSHCLLFSFTDTIQMNFAKIVKTDEKEGILLVEASNIEGMLLDIKPYFPMDYAKDNKNEIDLKIKNEFVGIFNNECNKSVIKLNNNVNLDRIYKEDYLRLLWFFDNANLQSDSDDFLRQPPHKGSPLSGVFATRSPVRPNPIASTIVKVINVNKDINEIEIMGFDGFNNTQVFQIMSYRTYNNIDEIVIPAWVHEIHKTKEMK